MNTKKLVLPLIVTIMSAQLTFATNKPDDKNLKKKVEKIVKAQPIIKLDKVEVRPNMRKLQISDVMLAMDDRDNGGDGFRQEDGSIEMRDFTFKEDFITDKNEFMRTIPGFIEILQAIYIANPSFAQKIWNDIKNSSIFLTTQELQILPAQNTSYYTTQPDVQIAIRNGNDILISIPAFEKSDMAYLLLHEAIHGISGATGSMHHLKVWNLVNYLKENRENLDKKQIDLRLRSFFGISSNVASSYTHYLDVKEIMLKKVKESCNLVNSINQNNSSYYSYELNAEKLFLEFLNPELKECRDIKVTTPEFIKINYPAIAKQLAKRDSKDVNLISIYSVFGEDYSYIKKRFGVKTIKQIKLGQCVNGSNPKTYLKVKESIKHLEELELEMELLEDSSTDSSAIVRGYSKVYKELLPNKELTNFVMSTIRDSKQSYENNLIRCKDVFKSKFTKMRAKKYNF